MLKALLDLNVASVRRRIAQGDCPTEPALSVETLEQMIHDLTAEPQDFASAPISLDARRADKARDSKLYSARDAMVEELRDIDAGVVEVDAMVLFTRIPDGDGLWTSGWRFAGLNTTEAVGFTALCLQMLMNEARTGG